jgi:hypothetical protein
MIAMLNLIYVMAAAVASLLALGILVDWRTPARQVLDWER